LALVAAIEGGADGKVEDHQGVSTVAQHSSPACGQACVKVACALLGKNIPLHEILHAVPEHPGGASIADLARVVEAHGFKATMFRESLSKLDLSRGLAIVRVRLEFEGQPVNHYVVIREAKDGRFLVIDPFKEFGFYSRDSLENIYLGDGIKISMASPGLHWQHLMGAPLLMCGIVILAVISYSHARQRRATWRRSREDRTPCGGDQSM
jgi:predicted double-glycine peptidase